MNLPVDRLPQEYIIIVQTKTTRRSFYVKNFRRQQRILKFNAEGVDPGVIWTEACVAGKTAVEEYVAKLGNPCTVDFRVLKLHLLVANS
jgi:hypothetical protein